MISDKFNKLQKKPEQLIKTTHNIIVIVLIFFSFVIGVSFSFYYFFYGYLFYLTYLFLNKKYIKNKKSQYRKSENRVVFLEDNYYGLLNSFFSLKKNTTFFKKF